LPARLIRWQGVDVVKKNIIILLALLLGCGVRGTGYSQEEAAGMKKKVVMIVAQSDFRDEELLEPKAILERNGIEVKIASTSLSSSRGMLGAEVNPDILVSDINIRDFAAIILIGGIGASQYWDDSITHRLIQEAVSSDRLVAAICIAPVTLARAGVLKGRRATVWSSEADKLKSAQANYTGRPVERDGNIITASGPTAAREFADEILEAIRQR